MLLMLSSIRERITLVLLCHVALICEEIQFSFSLPSSMFLLFFLIAALFFVNWDTNPVTENVCNEVVCNNIHKTIKIDFLSFQFTVTWFGLSWKAKDINLVFSINYLPSQFHPMLPFSLLPIFPFSHFNFAKNNENFCLPEVTFTANVIHIKWCREWDIFIKYETHNNICFIIFFYLFIKNCYSEMWKNSIC